MKSRREDKQAPTKAEMLSRHLLVQNCSRFWSRYALQGKRPRRLWWLTQM